MRTSPLKVLICGTHPVQTNGYSRVIYELVKTVSEQPQSNVIISIYGFQKHKTPIASLVEERAIPNIEIYDASAFETPPAAGFGFTEFEKYVETHAPDVVVVFNDMSVLCGMVDRLKDMPSRKKFKIVAYIDQVYLSQKRHFIEFVNTHTDIAMAFTPYWKANLRKIGISLPLYHLRHGFNSMKNFPIPRHLARKFFGLADDDFLILNLNRNQPRKRWDKCMQTLAEVVAREPESRIRLVVATELGGAFDIQEIYERELQKWGVSSQKGFQHILKIQSPQAMSDSDINTLYNAVDIGINTCDGEGFGLCNFENAAVGVPQVVSGVGGFLDFFDDTCSILVQPKTTFYIDCTRDAVGGEAQMCDQHDFASGIIKYYKDPVLRKQHGDAARKKIMNNYAWDDIATTFCKIMHEVAPLEDSSTIIVASNPLDISHDEVASMLQNIS